MPLIRCPFLDCLGRQLIEASREVESTRDAGSPSAQAYKNIEEVYRRIAAHRRTCGMCLSCTRELSNVMQGHRSSPEVSLPKASARPGYPESFEDARGRY
jgi:hypothetical protein